MSPLARQGAFAVDELELRLIRQLKSNARASVVELANALGQPRTTINDRLRRLETLGVITGYTVKLDHSRVGEPQTAFVMLQMSRRNEVRPGELPTRILGVPGVEELHAIAGDWDAIVKIRAASMQDLFEKVEKLAQIPGITRTVTLSCFKTFHEPI